ncbi:hypothetical protein RUM43_008883 [Polyplax serrata]|uniref:Uncharacterized protein n=1 Tax=Polyplax serrata TaxID=468196 RepID=A0AAN8NZ16_POLSC
MKREQNNSRRRTKDKRFSFGSGEFGLRVSSYRRHLLGELCDVIIDCYNVSLMFLEGPTPLRRLNVPAGKEPRRRQCSSAINYPRYLPSGKGKGEEEMSRAVSCRAIQFCEKRTKKTSDQDKGRQPELMTEFSGAPKRSQN